MKGELIQDVRTPSGTIHPKGTVVYEWNGGYTFAVLTRNEVAVTLEEGQTPFFGVPETSVKWHRESRIISWFKELTKKLTNLF